MPTLSDSIAGVWSATPTPFKEDLSLDFPSIERMVAHHQKIGVQGIMLGGTCGEGPWMPPAELEELARAAVTAAEGQLRVIVQVTDNSARRMLANIERIAAAGAELAVFASPYFLLNGQSSRLLELYLEVIRKSPLPVGFYDRGKSASCQLAAEHLGELLAEPNLVLVKDSSGDAQRRSQLLQAASSRRDLSLLMGDEFDCVPALRAGYRGVLLGGGIFNGLLANQILRSVLDGPSGEAEKLQSRMNELMYRIYGGPGIECWLAGLKYLLVRMGLFESSAHYLGYRLTADCRAAIDEMLDGEDADAYRADLLPEEIFA